MLKFFDKDKIKRIFIHEYIQGSYVRYRLIFHHYDVSYPYTEKYSIPFKFVYPGVFALQQVYSCCLSMLQTTEQSSLGVNND
jgi:hypothetical protein